MRILFLTQTTELGPSSRYRVYQFLPALRAAGIESEVSPAILSDEYAAYFGGSKLAKARFLPRIAARRKRDLERMDEFDVTFVQKEFAPVGQARLTGRVIYDVDDAVFDRMPAGTTRVLAGNEFLASRFANAVVMPTVVDTERFRPAERRSQGAATVGWIGSRTTMKYLKLLPKMRLKVVSSEPPAFPCEFERWSLEREVEQVQSFDIGVAPLADTEWERGKCGLKTLQYMACGIPVVASPVGVQREFVERSGGGLLASTPEEWREKIARLSERPDERRAMGERGRAFVEANYSLCAWASRWIEALRAVAGGK
jgi:glycosyltransferase involved in cell wall biosynthesis